MQILYFIPGPLSARLGAQELERRRNFLCQFASPGTEVTVWDAPDGPASIESAVEEYLAVPHLLEGVARAERAGFDALIVGCFGDPGLDAARELASIPVIGPCEASLVASIPLGHRLSIITVLGSVTHPIRRAARAVGLEGRLASIRSVEVPVLDLGGSRVQVVSAFFEQGKKAIQEDGADMLVPGCMSMAFLGIAEEAQKRLGVPVIDPAAVSLKLAELYVACRLAHSKKVYPFPPKGTRAVQS